MNYFYVKNFCGKVRHTAQIITRSDRRARGAEAHPHATRSTHRHPHELDEFSKLRFGGERVKLRIAVRIRRIEYRTAHHVAFSEGPKYIARRPRLPQVAVSHDDVCGGEFGEFHERVLPRIGSNDAEMGKSLRESLSHDQLSDRVVLDVKDHA